jgi:hypothetical protein
LAAHHRALQALGIAFGPAFRLVERGWRGKDEALAKIAGGANASAFAWPPALDAALQAIGLSSETLELRLFSGLDGLWLSGELPANFFAHAVLDRCRGEAEVRADVRLYDEAGREIGALNGVALRRASAGAFDPLCYRVEWVPVGAAAASSAQLPSPADCVSAAEEDFAALAEVHDLWRHHDELGVQLDRLTLLHIAEALRSLGFDDTPNRRFDLAAEGARLGVANRHVRTFRKIVDLLVDNGICARDGDCAATISERLPVEAADPQYPALIECFDPASGELRLLRRCGGSLAEALRDRVDPAALLFPDGSFEDARRIYDDAPSARTFNGTLAAALQRLIIGKTVTKVAIRGGIWVMLPMQFVI